MNELWKAAVGVAGIGAVGAFVFWSLYKGWLARVPIVDLTKRQLFILFLVFLGLTFLFALAALATYAIVASSLPSSVVPDKTDSPPSTPVADSFPYLGDREAVELLKRLCSTKPTGDAGARIYAALCLGGPLLEKSRYQLEELVQAIPDANIEIISLAAVPRGQRKLVSQSLHGPSAGVHVYDDVRALIDDNKIDVVFLLGFLNAELKFDSDEFPFDLSHVAEIAAEDALNCLIVLASRLGKHCYVFADGRRWNPERTLPGSTSESPATIVRRSRIVCWSADVRGGDNLVAFCNTVRCGGPGAGTIVPRKE